MPDEENTQPATANAPPSPEATTDNAEPPTTEAPVQQVDFPPEEIFQTPQEQSVPVPENSQPEQISEPAPEPNTETSTEQNNPNIVIEKTPDSVTITEVMQPEPKLEVSRGTLDTPPSLEASVGQSKSFLKNMLPKLKEKLNFRTEKRLTKIMELARKKAEKGESIQNDNVEKLLHVSDATASRYLKKLIERGQLKNISNPKWPKYSPN